MSKIIGITGGIGCGKSTLIEMMKQRANVLDINTDNIAKKIMEPNTPQFKKIVDYFSDDILTNGCIDNNKLSKIVMNNPDKLKKLNSFVHPSVIHEVKELVKTDKYDIITIESALLLETELKDLCDEIWNVSARLETRIYRLCKYRGYSEEKAKDIIKNQKSDEYYISNSTKTFINNRENGADMEHLLEISL